MWGVTSLDQDASRGGLGPEDPGLTQAVWAGRDGTGQLLGSPVAVPGMGLGARFSGLLASWRLEVLPACPQPSWQCPAHNGRPALTHSVTEAGEVAWRAC